MAQRFDGRFASAEWASRNSCHDGSEGGLLEQNALLRNESVQRFGERFA
jgi:hypothetical protein